MPKDDSWEQVAAQVDSGGATGVGSAGNDSWEQIAEKVDSSNSSGFLGAVKAGLKSGVDLATKSGPIGLLTGTAKNAATTGTGAYQLGEKLAGVKTPNSTVQSVRDWAENKERPNVTWEDTANNLTEKVGDVGADIAVLGTPMGSYHRMAKAMDAAAAAKSVPGYARRAMRLGLQPAVSSIVSGSYEGIKSGGDEDKTKAALMVGGLLGGAGQVLAEVSPVLYRGAKALTARSILGRGGSGPAQDQAVKTAEQMLERGVSGSNKQLAEVARQWEEATNVEIARILEGPEGDTLVSTEPVRRALGAMRERATLPGTGIAKEGLKPEYDAANRMLTQLDTMENAKTVPGMYGEVLAPGRKAGYVPLRDLNKLKWQGTQNNVDSKGFLVQSENKAATAEADSVISNMIRHVIGSSGEFPELAGVNKEASFYKGLADVLAARSKMAPAHSYNLMHNYANWLVGSPGFGTRVGAGMARLSKLGQYTGVVGEANDMVPTAQSAGGMNRVREPLTRPLRLNPQDVPTNQLAFTSDNTYTDMSAWPKYENKLKVSYDAPTTQEAPLRTPYRGYGKGDLGVDTSILGDGGDVHSFSDVPTKYPGLPKPSAPPPELPIGSRLGYAPGGESVAPQSFPDVMPNPQPLQPKKMGIGSRLGYSPGDQTGPVQAFPDTIPSKVSSYNPYGKTGLGADPNITSTPNVTSNVSPANTMSNILGDGGVWVKKQRYNPFTGRMEVYNEPMSSSE